MAQLSDPKDVDRSPIRTIPGVGVARLGTCRGCHLGIWWAKHPTSGRAHPYNLDGVSHFATCPKADRFRPRKPVKA